MQTLRDIAAFPPALRGGALCVGNFDGVHVGHARMLATGRDLARARGVPFTVMTFDPHPSAVLFPDTARAPLTTLDQREALLAAFSPDVLLVAPVTREFLSIPAETFLADTVAGTIGAAHVVEGPTFTFGRGAKGDVAMLKARGPALGFETTVVDTVEIATTDLLRASVSSSAIRWFVQNGRVLDAAAALGRPYTLRGPVVHGHRRGRTIGFPTANVRTAQLLPAPGVYAGTLTAASGETRRAAVSVGTNPTFDGTATTVEAYVLDFADDLYGQTVDLAFHRYLREMTRFGGVDALVAQMHKDVAATRAAPLIAATDPMPTSGVS